MSTHYGRCGYAGCYDHGTRFISRYRDQNDYCVDGTRVTLYDSGEFHGSPAQARAVLLFELSKYTEYIAWNRQQRAKFGEHEWTALKPFDYAAFAANIAA